MLAPITEKASERKVCAGMEVGVTGMQGWRTEMEDAHICHEMPSKKTNVIVGVFDGHGGKGAAIWIEKVLISFVEKTTDWKKYVASGTENPELVGSALRQAFLDADAELRVLQDEQGPGMDTSGCTSVVCIVTPMYIICANTGDSRCILATNKDVKAMSFDHKPTDVPERARIEAAGGWVEMGRVDGDLAVSRALGDFQFKDRKDLPAEQQRVSPVPDIIIHKRVPEDEFLLIACDGLWDVITNGEASDFGRSLFLLGEENMMLFAEEMIDLALKKGSRDNISAVAMKLDGASISKGEGVLGLRAERAADEAAAALKREQAAMDSRR